MGAGHLLGRPLHKELVELPVEEEEGAGEADGGQEIVLRWHQHHPPFIAAHHHLRINQMPD